jgi:peptide/nickel transport system substrate-binding protein
VEVVDDLTVRMKLNYPFRWDANVANSWGVNLMCDSMADKSAEWIAEGNGIGTGPYMFESYEPGVRLILTKFEDWWGVWPEGHFTKIVIEEVEDATVRVQKLRGGEADIAQARSTLSPNRLSNNYNGTSMHAGRRSMTCACVRHCRMPSPTSRLSWVRLEAPV